MPNKLLFSLLMRGSSIAKMYNLEIAQQMLLKEFESILGVDNCAVYLEEKGRPGYFLSQQYNACNEYGFAEFWLDDVYNSLYDFRYINDPMQLEGFFFEKWL